MAGWSIVGNRYPFTYSEPPERFVLRRTDNSDSVVYIPERTCKAELMPKNRELRMAPWLECSECGAELSAYGTDKYCHGCGAKVVSE